MKRISCLLFALALLLVGCGEAAPEVTTPTTQETRPVDTYPYPEIHQKLTWDAINAQPVKRADMTIQEMREACVSFMRFSKTALWTPSEDLRFIRNYKGVPDEMLKGNIYGGLPYISGGTGNVYRMMDYLDEETGVMDLPRAAKTPWCFGNQCSYGAYWAWGRIMSSARYDSTVEIVVANNFVRVGPYTYDDSIPAWSKTLTTAKVCQENGEQVMYASYAAVQPADGLVYFTSGGHVIMCAALPHVEYLPGTGEIDGDNSYLLIVDQFQDWKEGTNEQGDTFLFKKYIDRKMTFRQLYNGSHLPFTFKEFMGTVPVAETVCAFSFTGDTITVGQLFEGTVTSNYGMSDIYATVKNAGGEEIYRHAVRIRRGGTKVLQLIPEGDNTDSWGTLDVSKGEFTVEVTAQLSTGERPTVYQGRLVGANA